MFIHVSLKTYMMLDIIIFQNTILNSWSHVEKAWAGHNFCWDSQVKEYSYPGLLVASFTYSIHLFQEILIFFKNHINCT